MPKEDVIAWLQQFYLLHCDGDWEHSYGFSIENIDNPGWLVKFDLADTKLSVAAFSAVDEQRSEFDWVMCSKEADRFVGSGGALNLSEILSIFRQWAEANLKPGESPWLPPSGS